MKSVIELPVYGNKTPYDFRLKRTGARVDSIKVNTWDFIPVMLLMLLGLSLATGAGVVLVVLNSRAKARRARAATPTVVHAPVHHPAAATLFSLHRPNAWLAVRSHSLRAVPLAFGLSNPKPCTWLEGLAGEQKLFIAPPVKGWILIVGSGLPDPGDDVDVCFRFLLGLSRKLGRVQYFSASRVLNHHAWVWVETGRVVRAYAWAGRTLWNQGVKTRAELELGLKCFHYLELPERSLFGRPDVLAANTEKVPLLAARWSLDPATLDERIFEHARGIAGEPSHFY